jgi:hypothetical protein
VDGAELARFATALVADAVPRLPVSACNQLSGVVVALPQLSLNDTTRTNPAKRSKN